MLRVLTDAEDEARLPRVHQLQPDEVHARVRTDPLRLLWIAVAKVQVEVDPAEVEAEAGRPDHIRDVLPRKVDLGPGCIEAARFQESVCCQIGRASCRERV